MKITGRRKFLKHILSEFVLAILLGISFSQSNPHVVIANAGIAGLSMENDRVNLLLFV